MACLGRPLRSADTRVDGAAFGLRFAAPFALPVREAGRGEPEACIRVRRVANPSTQESVCIPLGEGIVLGVGVDQISCYAPRHVSDATLRALVMGPATGALLRLRGKTVLHGSSVTVGTKTLLFLGASGAGKSTMAAALQARGGQVLTDDLVVLDESGRVLPGWRWLKLWPDSARFVPGTNRLHELTTKRVGRVRGTVASRRPDVVFLLSAEATPTDPESVVSPSCSNRWTRTDALDGLWSNVYGARTLAHIGLERTFRMCAALASDVPVHALRRTDNMEQIDELIRIVLEHVR